MFFRKDGKLIGYRVSYFFFLNSGSGYPDILNLHNCMFLYFLYFEWECFCFRGKRKDKTDVKYLIRRIISILSGIIFSRNWWIKKDSYNQSDFLFKNIRNNYNAFCWYWCSLVYSFMDKPRNNYFLDERTCKMQKRYACISDRFSRIERDLGLSESAVEYFFFSYFAESLNQSSSVLILN